MQIIFGLGNPGRRYTATRHNVGQMVIKNLAAKLNLKLSASSKFLSEIAQTGSTLLGISTGYMNLSGNSVARLANFYKIDPSDIYIIHDELDLPVGEYKGQFDRGSAGHNGIKSIIDSLGTQTFNRIRVGIGHPHDSQNPSLPVEEYVLQPFTADEKMKIDETVDKIVEELVTLIHE